MDDPPRRGTLRQRSLQRVSSAGAPACMRLKFLLVGDAAVGKTSWLRRVKWEALQAAQAADRKGSVQQATDSFLFDARCDPTVGVDLVAFPATIRRAASDSPAGVRVQPNVFDLGGSPEYQKVRLEFYSDYAGLLLCFDLGSKASWDHVDAWWQEVSTSGREPQHVLVLGLKSDLSPERRQAVNEREVKAWCKGRGASYFECSAKTGAGVNQAWMYLVEHAQGEAKPTGGSVPPPQQPPPSSSQQRPPSASPAHSPSHSPSASYDRSSGGGAGGGGPTNISELTLVELKRECLKRGVSFHEETATHSDLLARLREHLARERTGKADAAATESQRLEKQREAVLADVARWALGKDVRAMLNDIHGWTPGDGMYLEKLASFAPVQLAYKKAVVKIHPDKAS